MQVHDYRIDKNKVEEILDKIKDIKVGVIGDISLDMYWYSDMRLSELSRETPQFPLPVVKEVSMLGSGGNVVANMSALKPKEVYVLTAIGKDWRAHLIKEEMSKLNINTKYLIEDTSYTTAAYCKPMRMGISDVVYEDSRIDFQHREVIQNHVEEMIIENLDRMCEEIDILAVSDQFIYSVVTDKVREHLKEKSKQGLIVVVDSREKIGLYDNVIVKPNEVEIVKAIGDVNLDNQLHVDDFLNLGLKLRNKTNRPVVLTLGEKGSSYINEDIVYKIEAEKQDDKIDIVGAGDTFLAAFCCSYATKCEGYEALALASLASAVTIRKIGMTGVATPEEILSLR